jgi:hypothetical protein
MPTRKQCDEAARHRAVTRRRLPFLQVLAVVLMVGLAALLVPAPAQAIFNRLTTAPALRDRLTELAFDDIRVTEGLVRTVARFRARRVEAT